MVSDIQVLPPNPQDPCFEDSLTDMRAPVVVTNILHPNESCLAGHQHPNQEPLQLQPTALFVRGHSERDHIRYVVRELAVPSAYPRSTATVTGNAVWTVTDP
ncbi:hypothetical protein KC19_9G109500 [Ceratodon purpureus]|uniref:Uncharacterized protein n=1 Tax=Ceratodon purpureus TaxID=3225 RepID=A0A8T0GSU7_CERPU|nr:hypothetical protein KC19_9G109500 [Ceratodon purpureus]